MKNTDDTTRLQPSFSFPDMMYVAQVVYEVKRQNQWLMRLIVVKHNEALLEVSAPITQPIMILIIQYVITSLPVNVERDMTFQFLFEDSNGFIELVFDEEQEYPYNGWNIRPHTIPSRVCILIYYDNV